MYHKLSNVEKHKWTENGEFDNCLDGETHLRLFKDCTCNAYVCVGVAMHTFVVQCVHISSNSPETNFPEVIQQTLHN